MIQSLQIPNEPSLKLDCYFEGENNRIAALARAFFSGKLWIYTLINIRRAKIVALPPYVNKATGQQRSEILKGLEAYIACNKVSSFQWVFNGVFGFKNLVVGQVPPFKQTQSRLILDSIIHSLADGVSFTAADLRHLAAEIIFQKGPLPHKLIDAIIILFNLDPIKQAIYNEDACAQRTDLMSCLSELAESAGYQELSVSRDSSIVLAQLMAHALFTAPQWGLFEKVMSEVIGEDQLRNKGPIAELIQSDLEVISQSVNHKIPSLLLNFKKLQGQLGFGFTPSQDFNYYSSLFVERYVDNHEQAREIAVYRFPTATQDDVAQTGSRVVGTLRLWVDYLKAHNLRHCWFGHQKMEFRLDDREGARSHVLLEFSKQNAKTFYFFNLPLDGEIFNQTHTALNLDYVSIDTFKEVVGRAVFFNLEGFCFPDTLMTHQIFNQLFDEVSISFFSGQTELTKEERQTHLLLFYTRIERYFPLMLGASRNSSCKDGIDRGGIINALCYYLDLISLGKADNSDCLRDFRIVLHHAAFFVKTQAVIPSRSKLLLNALKHLEKVDLAKLKNDLSYGFFHLEGVHIPKEISRRYSQISDAKNPSQFFEAIDGEDPRQRAMTWVNFVERNLNESPTFLTKTMEVSVAEEKVRIPQQITRDSMTLIHQVEGKMIKEANADAAVESLLNTLFDMTKDKDQALRMASCHNQSVVMAIYEILLAHYRYAGEDDENDPLMLRPRLVEGDSRQVKINTYKFGNECRTIVTADYEIGRLSRTCEKRLVRADLKIDYRGPYTKSDYEAALKKSEAHHHYEILPNGCEAPDAVLTWQIGSNFPPLM